MRSHKSLDAMNCSVNTVPQRSQYSLYRATQASLVGVSHQCIEPLKIVSTEHPSLLPTKGKPFVRHHPSNITWLATHHHHHCCCTTNNNRSWSKFGENTLTDSLTFKVQTMKSIFIPIWTSRFLHTYRQEAESLDLTVC